MEPLLEYEELLSEETYIGNYQRTERAVHKSKGAFLFNFLLCVVLGVITLNEPDLLPYFILLTVLSAAMMLYQQFFRGRLEILRRRTMFQKSNVLREPSTVRLYSDRLEVSVKQGEEQTSFVMSFPYPFLVQVLESKEFFLLVLTSEKIIPVNKKNCTLAQQNQLRSHFSRYCRNYQEIK